MIDQNSTPEQIEAFKAEVTAATANIDRHAHQLILARAATEGWSTSQAQWLDTLAKQPLFQALLDGTPVDEAMERAYGEARRALTAGYFDNALNEGKNRYTAFLTVVDLEKQLAERRGEAPPAYPEVALLEACQAVEAAAERGLDREEQIAAGFAIVREASLRTLS